MPPLRVPIVNFSPNPLPAYATEGAAGMDVSAWLPQPVVLQSLERKAIPTGLYLALPAGTEAQVRPRSGLALKQGLTVLNSPGTIDADYRGEVQVILVNLSNQPVQIQNGERIAQLVIARYEAISWEPLAQLDSPTQRGTGGFGSTGV